MLQRLCCLWYFHFLMNGQPLVSFLAKLFDVHIQIVRVIMHNLLVFENHKFDP